MKIEMDTSEFRKAISEWVSVTNKDTAKALEDEMRLLVGQLIKFTPPFQGGNSSEAKKLGQNAVERDINKVFFVPDNKKAAKDLDPRDHQSRRDSRGRVRKPGIRIPVLKSSLSSYIKEIKMHVGKAAAGWNAAASKFKFNGVPSWVSRHGNGSGRAINNLNKNGDGYLEAINSAKGIVTLDASARILVNAMQSRVVKIKLRIENLLAKTAKKYSAK